jgi:putative RNA 2'-phosphotransferase
MPIGRSQERRIEIGVKLKRRQLSKLMSYVLGRRPDEFGLVLDQEGFVPTKELLQAIKEEDGWTYLRMNHIDEVLRGDERERFELEGNRIRARDEHSLPGRFHEGPVVPPTILYHGARNKAYPHIMKQGLSPMAHQFVHLSTSEDLAIRIGKRRDPRPVLITIQASKAHEEGIVFYRPNELIYLTESLAPKFLSGPPLPKEIPPKKEKSSQPKPPPGSIFPDIGRELARLAGPARREKGKEKSKRDAKGRRRPRDRR